MNFKNIVIAAILALSNLQSSICISDQRRNLQLVSGNNLLTKKTILTRKIRETMGNPQKDF